MKERLKLFVRYLQNNRIDEYENILKMAKIYDYEIISLRDYIEDKHDNDKKLLILRHDVDHLSEGTRMMFEVEKKYGVTSSFYFRNSTYEPTLMKAIESHGSESSLHFEPIADYVKARPELTNKNALFETDFQEKCLDILKNNIERFRLLCDIPCVTIASHGEIENVLVSTPNNFLTENTDVYKYLEIKLEAYNKVMLSKVTCYISDAPIEINNGYIYGISALQAIKNSEKFIMFLSHPNHWHYSFLNKCKKLLKVVVRKPEKKNTEFKRL